MLKRKAAVALALAIAMTAVGCGSADAGSDKEETAAEASTEEAAEEDSKEEDSKEEDSKEEDTTSEEASEEEASEEASTEEEEDLTAADVAQKAIDQLKGVESLYMDMNIVMNADVTVQGESAELNMEIKLSAEGQNEPRLGHTWGTIDITAGDQQQSTTLDTYTEILGDTTRMYMSMDDSAWTVQEQETPEDTSLYSDAVYQAIVNGDVDAELRMEDDETYAIETTLSGDLLKDAFERSSASVNSGAEFDYDKLSAPVTIYISAEDFYPVGMDMDLVELGETMIASMVGVDTDDTDTKVDIKEYTAKVIYDDYNEKTVEIPEEVLEEAGVSADGEGAEASETEGSDEEASDDGKTSGKPSAAGSAELGDDWTDMKIALDGKVYTVPFAYEDIKDTWIFDLAEYGYEDGYVMNPGDKVAGTNELKNDKADDELRFWVGFENNGSKAADITECDIWSIDIDITWCETDNYPSLVLPGGITWGSTEEDVVAAYGEPEDEPYESKELGYKDYEYRYEYSYVLRLTVYEDGGVKEISLQNYD